MKYFFLKFWDMEMKRKILKSHETHILREARDYDLWLVSRDIVLLEIYLSKQAVHKIQGLNTC